MAGGHRSHKRVKGNGKRSRGVHRAKPRLPEPYTWLGAAALTLGMGAALAGGSGIARADPTATGTSSSALSSGAGTTSGTSTSGTRKSGTRAGSSAGAESPKPNGTAPTSTVPSSGGKHPATTTTTTGTSSTTSATSPRVPVSSRLASSTPKDSTPSPGVTVSTNRTPPTDPTPSPGAAVTAVVHHDVVAALTKVHTGLDAVSPNPATGSSVSGDSPVTGSAPAVTTAMKPAMTLAAVVSSSPTPAVVHAAVAVVTPPVTPAVPALPTNLVVGLLAEVFSVVNTLISPNPAVPPTNPLQLLVFEVLRRIETTLGVVPVVVSSSPGTSDPLTGTNPVSTAAGVPSPGDVVQTPYGEIGKWLLQSNGQISDFGGAPLGGKKLLEPINVIILDPTATTAAAATANLNADLSLAGFPAQLVHTTGFQGTIDGQTYGQQPTGILEAFSDNSFLLPDDHARAFGPAPAEDGTGYVFTVAASRETLGLDGLLPTHTYVSFDYARDELANQLVSSGVGTVVGIVPLDNAYNSATETTGDNDGYAVVIQLNN
jgi:hypothetical protein